MADETGSKQGSFGLARTQQYPEAGRNHVRDMLSHGWCSSSRVAGQWYGMAGIDPRQNDDVNERREKMDGDVCCPDLNFV